jgi:pimeloyl-ACP methyl ester carboxylesterase
MRVASDHDPAALFTGAYQHAVDCWQVPVTSVKVPTGYGATHVLSCGPEAAASAVLLPGGGATATAWKAVAAGLSGSRRVIAVDPVGQPGLSVPDSRPVSTTADLVGWLAQALDSLAVQRTALIGHSYGAWTALQYALHDPGRVTGLVLLDPTDTFAPLSLRYRLHAIAALARPSATRMRRFLAWETRGRPLDEAWLAVIAAAQGLGRMKIVIPGVPPPSQLADLHLPVLVLIAGRSRAHDPRLIARRARDRLPAATIATLPRATHHTIPVEDADQILGHIEPFLASAC